MALGSVLTLALTQRSQSIPTSGMVIGIGVGVYADQACSQNLTGISWGVVAPGESVNRTVYVKNTGNAQITLSMAASGWSPPTANGRIAVSWDRESSLLGASQSVAATIVLFVSPSISGVSDFSVKVVIADFLFVFSLNNFLRLETLRFPQPTRTELAL